jgi:tetratricopeptide (TPR) repeat protein
MWPTSTEGRRATARTLGRCARLLLVGAALCGCAGRTPQPDAVAAARPDPEAVSRYENALADLREGDDLQAEAQLQALAASHPGYAGPLVNLALIEARRGELAPATALLERAVTSCEHCAAAWNELGVLQRQQGRFAEAEQSYRNAIAADASHANAWFNLGVLYELYLQRPELALDHYARFRELQAEDPLAADVDKWIADLKRRARTVERSAQLEDSP